MNGHAGKRKELISSCPWVYPGKSSVLTARPSHSLLYAISIKQFWANSDYMIDTWVQVQFCSFCSFGIYKRQNVETLAAEHLANWVGLWNPSARQKSIKSKIKIEILQSVHGRETMKDCHLYYPTELFSFINPFSATMSLKKWPNKSAKSDILQPLSLLFCIRQYVEGFPSKRTVLKVDLL